MLLGHHATNKQQYQFVFTRQEKIGQGRWAVEEGSSIKPKITESYIMVLPKVKMLPVTPRKLTGHLNLFSLQVMVGLN